MRILLASLNAKYVHTNLALRYLREEVKAEFPDVILKEFTINESIAGIAGEIFEAKADVIGFSCYIWNMNEILTLIRRLRPVLPQARIVLGGPEVSFEAEEVLKRTIEADVVVYGEGEETFHELLKVWELGQEPEGVAGLVWRRGQEIVANPPREVAADLNGLPFPYREKEDFRKRIVYVETTRGCPFCCQYCLSSTLSGVRYLEPERFREIFRTLLFNGARTIKFVDRTFNVNKKHAMAILDIVREEAGYYPAQEGIRVHCEIAGELLDEEWVKYLKGYPEGLLQLEVGVQSTYQPTLKSIARPQHFERWRKFVLEIQQNGQIPLHLDLIAGLPEEGWENFRTSFNDVYSVEPAMLQLGFLKVLKGSGLRKKSEQYGLVYVPDPPYTILETQWLTHSELLQLGRIEQVLDKYYNSGKFAYGLRQIMHLFTTPFDFYHQFALFWQQKEWFRLAWQGKALFANLWQFLEEFRLTKDVDSLIWERLRDSLRFDFYLWEKPNPLPDFLQGVDVYAASGASMENENRTSIFGSGFWETVKNDPQWLEKIPELQEMDHRQWNRHTSLEYFTFDVGSSKPGNSVASLGTSFQLPVVPQKERNQPFQDEGAWYLFFYWGKTRAFRLNVK